MATMDHLDRRTALKAAVALCAGAMVAPDVLAAAATQGTGKGAGSGGAEAAAAGTVGIGALRVNRLGFGAMRITGDRIMGPPRDPAEARQVLKRAIALGVNFIDTADAYGPDVSEELIAAALYPYPHNLVIATKGGFTRPASGAWVPDGSPAHLRAACEGSLKRLKRDHIDLYQLHTVDPKVPIKESIGALKQLQQEGKIRYIGVSNVSAAQLADARSVAGIVSVQNRFNYADHGSADVLAVCEREGLAFIPWGPLGVAMGPGPARQQDNSVIDAIAKRHGASQYQVAIAWLLARSKAMLPIPGTASVAHLEQNVAAAGVKLSAAEVAQLSS